MYPPNPPPSSFADDGGKKTEFGALNGANRDDPGVAADDG